MSDILDDKLKLLYPDYPHRFEVSRRKWFCGEALKDLEKILALAGNSFAAGERAELASLIFDTMEASKWKIEAFEKACSEAIGELVSEEIANALIPVVIGSVARFEAEAGGDIDPDFAVDTSLIIMADAKRQIHGLLLRINEKLQKMSPKDNVIFRLRPIQDIAIYSLDDLCSAIGVSHFANLMMGCYTVKHGIKINKQVTEAKSKTEERKVLLELRGRIEDDLERRKTPVKVGYTVAAYVLRMLALNFLSFKDMDKNYWRICELLHEKIAPDFLFEIAVLVRSLLYARRRVDRGEEVREWVKHKIFLNAGRAYTTMLRVKAKELA